MPVVMLRETLDMLAAAPLAAELLALRGQDVRVDARAPTRVGAQCLQVLLAARASWGGDGRRFVLAAPSADFVAAVTLLGAADLLAGAEEAGAGGAPVREPAAEAAPALQAA